MAVIECVGCSAKANDKWAVCPTCGANPKTGEQIVPVSTQPVDAAAVKAEGKSVSWGGWALGLVLAGPALTFIPFASPVFSAIGSLLWISGLILGIVGVISRPRALAITALVLCVLPITFELVMDAFV